MFINKIHSLYSFIILKKMFAQASATNLLTSFQVSVKILEGATRVKNIFINDLYL